MADEEREEVEVEHKTREAKAQAAALDRMADAAPEREMRAADMSRVKAAMDRLAAHKAAADEAARARERALADVKVAPADVDLLAAEFELDRRRAERRLREAGGDVRAAMRALVAVPWEGEPVQAQP